MGNMKHSNDDAQFRAPANAVIAREKSLWHQVSQVWSEKTLNFKNAATSLSLISVFWVYEFIYHVVVHVAVPSLWTREGCGLSLWV